MATKSVMLPQSKRPKSVTVNFELERETENTVRYHEIGTNGKTVKGSIGTLYVQKSVFAGTEFPKTLTVKLEF